MVFGVILRVNGARRDRLMCQHVQFPHFRQTAYPFTRNNPQNCPSAQDATEYHEVGHRIPNCFQCALNALRTPEGISTSVPLSRYSGGGQGWGAFHFPDFNCIGAQDDWIRCAFQIFRRSAAAASPASTYSRADNQPAAWVASPQAEFRAIPRHQSHLPRQSLRSS